MVFLHRVVSLGDPEITPGMPGPRKNRSHTQERLFNQYIRFTGKTGYDWRTNRDNKYLKTLDQNKSQTNQRIT